MNKVVPGIRRMSASLQVLQRLQDRANQADEIIAQLREQLLRVKKDAATKLCREEEAKLQSENASLKQEILVLKQKLTKVEVQNGLKQFSLPTSNPVQTTQPSELQKSPEKPAQQPNSKMEKPQQKPKEKKQKEAKPKPAEGPAPPVDVSRLNMRIGHIVTAKKHPDADGLYVEEVNLGEGRNRTIVSGLVKHVPLEQMQDRYAIFLLNLKPAKMRGIMSEGMIMCASTPEKVEIIVPPEGVAIGDRVTVDDYTGEPDAMMNPKKKIWEQIQPDLQINADGAATYKGKLWRVSDKGLCTVPTMRNSGIK